jgi:iron complex outermembrane receptor protein
VLVVYNGATAEIYGLDLDFKAKIDNAWRISGGIELLHSEYTSFPNADIASVTPGVGLTLAVGNATGNALPNAPAITGDISVDYLLEQPYGTFDFNVTDSYSSAFYQEADNFLSQPAYDLLNASVGLNSSDGHWRIKLFGNNLLNKAVATQLSTNAITPPTAAGVPALISNVDYASPPRTYGVSLRYSY